MAKYDVTTSQSALSSVSGGKIKKFEVASNDVDYAGNGNSDDALQDNQKTSYVESLIHLLKGNFGSGIFAVCEGFKNAGIILAPILTVILGLFSLYGEHLLLTSAEKIKRLNNMPSYPSFAETIEMGFAKGPRGFRAISKYMKPLVDFLIVITHLGFCCVYFIFISSTSRQVMQYYGVDISIRLNMFIYFIPILLFSLIRSLKYLVPLSMIANICMGFGICSTIYLFGYDFPPIESRKYVGDITEIPLFFGTIMYSFEGIGLVLPLKTSMKNSQDFDSPLGVLNVGMTLIITIIALFGFLGYLRYGDDIQSSVTLNLDPTIKLSIFVKIAIATAILFTYCLMFYVAMLVIWDAFNKKIGPFKNPFMVELLVRAAFVTITFVLSEVIPHLGLIISLIGAFSTTGLAMLIPPLCDISMRWPNDFGSFYFRLVLDLITLGLALVGFTTGTYFSLKAIFQAFFE